MKFMRSKWGGGAASICAPHLQILLWGASQLDISDAASPRTMTECLRAPFPKKKQAGRSHTTSSSSTTSYSRHQNSTEERSAPSSSLQMNRTSSAGLPGQPESPMAGSVSANTDADDDLATILLDKFWEHGGELSSDEEDTDEVYELWPQDYDATQVNLMCQRKSEANITIPSRVHGELAFDSTIASSRMSAIDDTVTGRHLAENKEKRVTVQVYIF